MEKLEEFKVGKTRRQPIPDGNPTETLNIWDVSKSIIGRPQDMYHIGIRGCIAFPAGWYAGHGESQQFDANHSTAIVNLDELRTFCTIWSQNISEWGIPKSQSVIGFHRFPHLNCHTCAIAFAFFWSMLLRRPHLCLHLISHPICVEHCEITNLFHHSTSEKGPELRIWAVFKTVNKTLCWPLYIGW
jgi:hypothetical protein